MNSESVNPAQAATPPLQQLIDTLCRRHGPAVNAMLFYGSCQRSGDLFDGLVDLYVLVDDYRSIYRRRWQALVNWLLPPNVFYIELAVNGQTLRCKYTVISTADFARGAARWFETYIWGRFTQPVEIAYARSEDDRREVQAQLECSTITFLNRVLPRLPPSGRVADLWREGLRLSYGVELRAERGGRAQELVEVDHHFYENRARAAAARVRFPLHLQIENGELHYRSRVPRRHRLLSRPAWVLRRIQGKVLSMLRLIKALFTFDGGLDYLAWKLERHSGQKIEIPERVRRYPLIFIWGLGVRLYRRGVFR